MARSAVSLIVILQVSFVCIKLTTCAISKSPASTLHASYYNSTRGQPEATSTEYTRNIKSTHSSAPQEPKNYHQRPLKQFPKQPSYDLIKMLEDDLIDSLERNSSHIRQREETRDIKRLVTRTVEPIKQNTADRKSPVDPPGGDRSKNEDLNDDIDTVDALIEMIALANRRLLEQRAKMNATISRGRKRDEPIRLMSNEARYSAPGDSAKRNKTSPQEPKWTFPSEQRAASAIVTLKIEQPAEMRSTKNETYIDKRLKKNRKKKRKSAPGDKSKPKTFKTTTERPQFETASKLRRNQPTDDTKRAVKSTSSGDLELVKPGFGHLASEDNNAQEVLQTRGQELSGRLQSPPLLSGAGVGAQQPLNEDLLPVHRPLIAKDLLHIRRQHQTPGHYDSGFLPVTEGPGRHDPGVELDQQHHLHGHSYPVQMVPSRFGLSPLYESHLQRAPLDYARLLARPQAGHSQPENDINRSLGDHQTTTTTSTTLPPSMLLFNGITRRPVHFTNGGQLPVDWLPQAQQQPASEQENRVPVRQHEDPALNPIMVNRLGETLLGPGVGGHPGQLQVSPLLAGNHHPLQQILMAARNQQEAAQAYERRRLDYEQELRQRDEAMRRQHELNLERQRQQAATATQKQNTNTASNENQNGGNENNNGQENNEANHENNNNDQPEENNEEPQNENNNENQQPEDQDMKNFQKSFDTDFTDLFPPGVLSEAEIKEMRRHQEEQRQREEQEEREKQQQQNEEQNEPEENNQQGENEQQQVDGSSEPSSNATQTKPEVEANKNSTKPVETSAPANVSQPEHRGSGPIKPHHLLPSDLPSYMFNNVTNNNLRVTNSTASPTSGNKQRRSSGDSDHRTSQMSPALMVLDTQFRDHYLAPRPSFRPGEASSQRGAAWLGGQPGRPPPDVEINREKNGDREAAVNQPIEFDDAEEHLLSERLLSALEDENYWPTQI